MTDTDRVFMRV